MVSVATFRTFEKSLTVSLTRLNSKQKPKVNVVLIFAMIVSFVVNNVTDITHWIRNEDHYLWDYASE